MAQQVLRQQLLALRNQPSNNLCADCGASGWGVKSEAAIQLIS